MRPLSASPAKNSANASVSSFSSLHDLQKQHVNRSRDLATYRHALRLSGTNQPSTSGFGDLSLTGLPSWHNAVSQHLSQLPITPFSLTKFSLSAPNDRNLHILKISASSVQTRHSGFDLLRVIAIYMVMQIHTGEFEYISPDGTVLHTAGSWAVGWTNSLLRVCAAVRHDYGILPFSHRR